MSDAAKSKIVIRTVGDDERFVVVVTATHVPCPEEVDFFRAAGVMWVPPEERL